jgi:aminoglycoside phosphotransferase (APT) family kinase protein
MPTEPGPLIASGRDGDIFEFGPGLVLRRTKDGRVIEGEARTIAYAREHGYPVPAIHEVRAGGTEIVMERINGPMMADEMMRAPWKMPRYCRVLAELHDRLHVIPAPDWLPDLGGDRLVHLDLHPMNVMMTASGPVVIDWPNAARGEPLLDVALTFILLTCPSVPGPELLNAVLRPARIYLGHAFAKPYRGAELDRALVQGAALKTLDRNMSPAEVAAIERAGARASARVSR